MLNFAIHAAHAVESGNVDAQPSNPIMSALPMVAVFVVFYFFMIRPQQKKSKEFAKMLEALKVGDKVATVGGIIGVIKAINAVNSTVEVAVSDNTTLLLYKKAVTDIISDTSQSVSNNKESDKKR